MHECSVVSNIQVKETCSSSAGKPWSLSRELFKLSKHGWYWGPITRVEAEEKLAGQADGSFLVRDSSDDRYLLSLSFRSKDVLFLAARLVANWPALLHGPASLYCHHVTSG